MAGINELKAVFAGSFPKDLSRFEPGSEGLVVGDNLRIYVGESGYVLRFLAGTPPSQRKIYTDRLDAGRLAYEVGPDFRF